MRRSTARSNRKLERRLTKPRRLQKLAAYYTRLKAEGKLNIQFAVITCIWRQGFTISETARVLNLTEDDVSFRRDLARQNA